MKKKFPNLITERLLINQPIETDIEDIVTILNDKTYSNNTTNIPYPYTSNNAVFWINLAQNNFEQQLGFIFAIRLRKTGKIIGAISLHTDLKFNKAELGYWLSKAYWNKGLATEAAKAVITFGFHDLKLKRIFATHFDFNIASGKVMSNAGMHKEGLLECYTKKDGIYQNHVLYAIINNDL